MTEPFPDKIEAEPYLDIEMPAEPYPDLEMPADATPGQEDGSDVAVVEEEEDPRAYAGDWADDADVWKVV